MPKGGITSYPTIWALGHPAIAELFLDEVLVEEKLDGSNASIALMPEGLCLRSKNAEIIPGDAGMFSKLVETAQNLQAVLHPGWVYRGEFIAKEHHNAVTYARVPAHFFILFDIMVGYEDYLPRAAKEAEAARLGLEVVPVLYQGMVRGADQLETFLEQESCLGGAKLEGVVCKNYVRFGKDKKPLMGKFVSEAFKELNRGSWKENNPTKGDVVEKLIEGLRSEIRWAKGIQHLRELGVLEDQPHDIGKLLIEIKSDVEKECKEEIIAVLWKHAWPQIQRGVVAGFPEWYKRKLMEAQTFAGEIPSAKVSDGNF